MNHKAAVMVRQILREKGRQNCGARTRKDGAFRRQAIEVGKQRFLHVEPLGRVLLNMIGIGERGGKGPLDPKASEQSLRTGPAE
jgi:hypothetical protein